MRRPGPLNALLLAALLTGGCAVAPPPDGDKRDIETLLQLSHAEDRFHRAVEDLARGQVAGNAELKPYEADIDAFLKDQLAWPPVHDALVADYAARYRPEEIDAIIAVLRAPHGERIVAHDEQLDRAIGGRVIAAAQARAPALEQRLRDVRNAREIGAPDSLTPEQDFAAVKAQAEGGDATAQLLLAEKYLEGTGTARDVGAALAWTQKAAAQDNPAALDTLAAFYYRGVGVPRDTGKARELMEKAAGQHYAPAVNNLAWLLATCPDAAQRDGRRAIALLEPVADQSAQQLDTLAAAHAEAGDFAGAIALQRRAILALDGIAAADSGGFLDRLQSYAAGKPWRDPPP